MSHNTVLGQFVNIAPYYQKSIRLTDDLKNTDALGGYLSLIHI